MRESIVLTSYPEIAVRHQPGWVVCVLQQTRYWPSWTIAEVQVCGIMNPQMREIALKRAIGLMVSHIQQVKYMQPI